MGLTRTAAASLAAALATTVLAQEHRLGEHPAVIVKRMYEHREYDYATKFYPHPAWLYLEAEAPRQLYEHPAVVVARQYREAQQNAAAVERERLAAGNR